MNFQVGVTANPTLLYHEGNKIHNWRTVVKVTGSLRGFWHCCGQLESRVYCMRMQVLVDAIWLSGAGVIFFWRINPQVT